MSFWVIVRISLKALSRNKIRSVLTMLGIIIGVGAVIAMVSVGQGAQRQVQEEIAAMGTNTLMVWTGSMRSMGVRGGTGTMNTLTAEDFEAMVYECPAVKAVSPSASTMGQVVFGDQNWSTRVEGYNEQLPALRNWNIVQGSFFDESHVKTAARVAVLGQTVVNQLFGGSDPVGQTIRIKNLPFRVLGVLDKKGFNAWGRDQDDTIMVPYTTVQKKFQGGVLYVQSGMVGAASARATYAAQEQITALLRQRHRLGPFQDDDFTVRNLSEIAETAEATNRIMTTLLASIAAVSLLVGGIGIMNIMLVAVSERTREIGIRMAIGARPGHVRVQFLSESIVLCVCGGILGLALGVGGSVGISQFLGWPTLISPNSIVISIIFSGAIGIFFGYYPAHKAAGLDPIEALRYE
ncbi:MAG: multidrug ABC transporter substrate-binding protein [Acidobacteria bacterium]|nr:MAG: multidrug ABC transporter substrate-binding protein [Acidobacteriota bacterium]